MMIRVKNHQALPTTRPDMDLYDNGTKLVKLADVRSFIKIWLWLQVVTKLFYCIVWAS